MTLLTPPAFLQAGTYTALLDRQYQVTALTQRNMNVAHAARQGFYPDRYPAYASTGGWNFVIGACAGVIANTFAADAGDYRFTNPANHAGAVAASSPTLNRNDIIGFQIKDNFYDGSGQNSVILTVVQGASVAGTAADPATPSSFIPVMRAVVAAGSTTPTYQDLRVRTVPPGVTLPVDSVTQRAAIGTPFAGQAIYRTDRGWTERHDGTAWRVEGVAITSSTTDRDTAITDPKLGQFAVTTDTGVLWRRNASAWVPHGTWRSTQFLAADAAFVHFSAIPSTFKALVVRWLARSTQAAVSVNALLRINGDAGLNYFANGTIQSNVTPVPYTENGTASHFVGGLAAATMQPAAFTNGEIVLTGWNNPNTRNQLGGLYRAHVYDTAANSFLTWGGTLYNGVGPYTAVTLLPSAGNFRAGTEVTVYGIE